MGSGTPKFFCENCGKEVRKNASFCPHCGKFFASVRCPVCNYTGIASRFGNGCPRCGYALKRENEKGEEEKKDTRLSQTTYYNGLPTWIYAMVFAVFLGVVFLFFFL